MKEMYVCGEEDKRLKEMERACVRVCSCEDNGKKEKRERMPEDFFFFRANSPEKSDLEVVNCTLKSSLSAGDLPRKCLAV